VDGPVLSWPYMDTVWGSLRPLLEVAAAVVVLTIVLALWLRRRGLPDAGRGWLVNAASAVAVLVVLAFTVRPYVQTVRSAPGSASAIAVAGYQAANHMASDPTNTYYQDSMHWVFWYLGVPVVILATLGAALLARHCLKGRAPTWVLPLVTFAWTIVTALYNPAITPDQPWASRRLVPAILPGFALLAVWGLSWIVGKLRRMRLQRPVYGLIVAVCLAALVLPEITTTYGLSLHRGGPAGMKVASVSTAFTATYRGEIGAINRLCSNLPGDSTAVFIDGPSSDRFAQVVRGMCGEPTGVVYYPSKAKVAAVVSGIDSVGRQPVLLAGTRPELSGYGPPATRIMYLNTQMDESTLITPPTTTWDFNWSIWMSEPKR
jgi:hypothetical protein